MCVGNASLGDRGSTRTPDHIFLVRFVGGVMLPPKPTGEKKRFFHTAAVRKSLTLTVFSRFSIFVMRENAIFASSAYFLCQGRFIRKEGEGRGGESISKQQFNLPLSG